jgi:hypothetical protein
VLLQPRDGLSDADSPPAADTRCSLRQVPGICPRAILRRRGGEHIDKRLLELLAQTA